LEPWRKEALIAKRVLEDDENFYTLTCTPHVLHFDNKWHRVRVEAGQYKLSYRHGYYDDATNQIPPREEDRKVPLKAAEKPQ
jgi:hypothetical protein